MQKRTIKFVILLIASTLVLFASTVTHLSFSQLSRLAHRVTAGRIERITSYRDAVSGRILSRVEVLPTRSISGSSSLSPLAFEMAGGTVGDLRQWIAGFPPLQAGDRVVLFLTEDPATPFGPTVGLWQGVFFIQTDPATGADIVADHRRQPISEIRDDELVVSEIPLATTRGASTEPIRAATAARLTLDAFVDRIRVLRTAGDGAARR